MNKPITGNLNALMVDDDGYHHDFYTPFMADADISLTIVPDSDSALRIFEHLHITKDPLDVFITDISHPGLPGPELIMKIRDLSDDLTMQGGLRLRHIPIVVNSAFASSDEIARIDPTIPVVMKTHSMEELLKAIDDAVRDFRKRILEDLQHVGIGIRFKGGRYQLYHCYSLRKECGFESRYIDATYDTYRQKAANAYLRLILIEDRHWSAQKAIQEFEYLLNSKKTKESDFQRFFSLHPEFLYQNSYIEHWSEPHLTDKSTGKLLKPDFILKSTFLPDRPWSWQIVDLKKPNVPLISNSKFHATLSHHVHKVVSQLRNYSEYFENPSNLDEINQKFGHQVRKPKLVAVIGRLPKYDQLQSYAKLTSQLFDVSIITYDEILEFRRSQAEWRFRSNIVV